MAITLRDSSTGGQSSSGTNQCTVELTGVQEGDLICVNGCANYDVSDVSDDASGGGNSYSDAISGTDAVLYYAVAKEDSATLEITVTFGASTAWLHRYANVAAFNPGGGAWNLADSDKSSRSYTTTVSTLNISATEDNVVAVGSFSNINSRPINSLNIDGSSPDAEITAFLDYGTLGYNIYSAGASSIDADITVSSSAWIEVGLGLFEVVAAGGTTHSATATDGVSFSETLTPAATFQAVASDGLSVGDSSGNLAKFIATLLSGVALSDTPAGIGTFPAALLSGVALSDTPAGIGTFPLSASDGLSVGDSGSPKYTARAVATDTVVFTDNLSVLFAGLATALDGIVFADRTSPGGIIQATAGDGLVFSDTISGTLKILAAVADGITLSELASGRAAFAVTVSDGAAFSDAMSAVFNFGVVLTDGFTVGDVSITTEALASGKVSVTFSSRGASVSFTVKAPSVAMSSR